MIWKDFSWKEDTVLNWRERKIQLRKIPRNESLDKEKIQGKDSKPTFNVTCYPVFRHLKSNLKYYM